MWIGLYQWHSALWAYALYHGAVLLPAIVLGRSLWQKSFVMPKFMDILILTLAAVLFCGVAVGAYELFGPKVLSNAHVPLLLQELGIHPETYWYFAFYGTVINPLVEEIFWRGMVFNELDKHSKPFKLFGFVWSSCLYALFHFLIFRLVLYPGYAEFGTLMLAGYGASMAMLYRRTGSIVTVAYAHGVLTDLACVAILIDYFRKFGMPLQ